MVEVEAGPVVPAAELQKDCHWNKIPVAEEEDLLAQEFRAEQQKKHTDLLLPAEAAAALRMGWREAAAAAVEPHRDSAYLGLVRKALLLHLHKDPKEELEALELLHRRAREEGHRRGSAAAAVDHMRVAEAHQKDSQEGLLLVAVVMQSHLVDHLEDQQQATPTKSRKQTDRKDSTSFSTDTLSVGTKLAKR